MSMNPGAASTAALFPAPVYSAVTVRVAWSLMMAGIRLRPAVLKDARDHVLYSLPRHIDADEAEQRTEELAQDYLNRVQGGRIRRVTAGGREELGLHAGLRARLVAALDPVSDAVLRLHYGDGMPLEQVERTAAIEGSALVAAQEGLRIAVRELLYGEGIDGAWTSQRLDQALGRLANMAQPGCPAPLELLSDQHRAHVDGCPRCSRAVRLIRGGLIAPSDLVAESDGQPHPEVVIGALILHPDARRVRRKLERAMGPGAVRAGPDVWLMSKDELARMGPGLRALVSDGVLPRHHLRGAVVRGPGRWSGASLLGPTAVEAVESARARPWSEIDTLGELPPPRPAPPRATRWWVASALLMGLTAIVGVETFKPRAQQPDAPIQASFMEAEDGWEITFDMDDLAVLDIVALSDDGLNIVHRDVRAERGQWATGGGEYRVYVPDTHVALIASTAGVQDLSVLVKAARSTPTPFEALKSQVLLAHPTVAWVASPAITGPEAPPEDGEPAQQ
jgi:hypothetical protein